MNSEQKAQQHRHKLAAQGYYPTDAGAIWADEKYTALLSATLELLQQLKPSDLFAVYIIGARLKGNGLDGASQHRADMITEMDYAQCLLNVEPELRAAVMQTVKAMRGLSDETTQHTGPIVTTGTAHGAGLDSSYNTQPGGTRLALPACSTQAARP